jgi:hypothetical protein
MGSPHTMSAGTTLTVSRASCQTERMEDEELVCRLNLWRMELFKYTEFARQQCHAVATTLSPPVVSRHTQAALGTPRHQSDTSRPDWEKKERVRHNIPHRHYRLGIGVTLNVAEWMVLDCCLYVLRDEEQVYTRIDRMGNLNHQVTT